MLSSIGLFIVVVAGIAAFHLFWNRRQAANPHRAVWNAFSATFAAALFIITGSIGFGLQKGPALLSESRWSDGVIWPQVGLGLLFLPAVVFYWRKAVRDTDRYLQRLQAASRRRTGVSALPGSR